ncbi:unnamed protein product, partial [Mesorhabditis belari]|uniref:Uncharacterized protein n=1 Tax=Mesorhabditis belari TaxID=2138241 RepID=A0AAF3FQP2_9BILA
MGFHQRKLSSIVLLILMIAVCSILAAPIDEEITQLLSRRRRELESLQLESLMGELAPGGKGMGFRPGK